MVDVVEKEKPTPQTLFEEVDLLLISQGQNLVFLQIQTNSIGKKKN